METRRSWFLLAGGVLVVGCAGLAALASHGDEPAPRAAAGRELFASYCIDCHSGASPRGALALDRLLDDSKARTAARGVWEKIWKLVRHEFMPPAHAEKPSDSERRAMTRWIEREVFDVDEARPDPGRVTIRRLNRMEYHYTVRDLFGIELDLASELPPDDTALGFDNIGDAQTLAPTLLETYLTLAEKVVAQVVSEDGPRPPQLRVRPEQFHAKKTAKGNEAQQAAAFELRHDGRYRVELQLGVGGWQEYGGEYQLNITLGGQVVVAKKTISVGGNKTHTFAAEVTLPRGSHDLLVATLPTKAGASGKLAPLPLSPRGTLAGPIDAGVLEYPAPHQRIFFKGPAPAEPQERRAYARAIVERVAAQAFRRPPEAATLERLTELVVAGKSFESGVAVALTAILSSPRFFYRAELQPNPDEPAAVHPLDDHALAARLSYLLWLSVPDDELTSLAARGRLRAELPRQLRRMLADPKAERFFEDFAGQWLRTRNILLAPVSGRVQRFVDPLRPVMKRETEMLFEHVARQERDLIELLTADYTFLDEQLAAFYGVAGVKGEQMRRVSLPADSHRAGVLTHASVLIATSNPNRTSPVKRGLFVLENLLGREVPPPPPAVGNLEDVKSAGQQPQTLREQLAAHRSQKACAACHAHFDPIGLALENFDNTGRWRDQERSGAAIEAKSELLSGEVVSGAADLARALAGRRRKELFYRCVTEKLLTYALGRGLEPSDAATVDRITASVAADGGKFSTLLAAVVESAPFQMRRGDTALAAGPTRVTLPQLKRAAPAHKKGDLEAPPEKKKR